MNAPLIRHLEAHLGRIGDVGNYAFGDATDPQPHFTIAAFADRPVPGADTLVTVGLSNMVLHQETRHVREELMLSFGRTVPAGELAAILHAIAVDVRSRGTALLRGEVIPPRGPVVDGSPIEAFLCTHPGFFPEEFDVVHDEEPPIALVWLAPLTAAETWFAAQHGWEQLLDLLLEEDETDLLDLYRDTSPAVLDALPRHDPSYAARFDAWAERRFGRIDEVRAPHRPFRLARFADGATFATTGLSGTEVHDRDLAHVRQELVLEWPARSDRDAPWDVLQRIADELLAHSSGIADGDTLNASDYLAGTGFDGLRCVHDDDVDGIQVFRLVPVRVDGAEAA